MQKEDLEFSVGSKQAVWEVKDPLLAGGSGADYDYQEDASSNFHAGAGGYNQYGGGQTASLVGGISGQQLYGGPGKQQGGHAGGYGGPGRSYPPGSERY